MRCPFCKATQDKVIDSRASNDQAVIRRRRQCLACEKRYTTYERIEDAPFRVVKKDGSRVPFDREKIRAGMLRACQKRPIPPDRLEELTLQIESEVNDQFNDEVSSAYIGDLVMEKLRYLDRVAYVRFASVYRDFSDIKEFDEFLDELRDARGEGDG